MFVVESMGFSFTLGTCILRLEAAQSNSFEVQTQPHSNSVHNVNITPEISNPSSTVNTTSCVGILEMLYLGHT